MVAISHRKKHRVLESPSGEDVTKAVVKGRLSGHMVISSSDVTLRVEGDPGTFP